MIAAILSLTMLGAALGMALGVVNKFLAVEGNPVVDELIAMMLSLLALVFMGFSGLNV